MILFPHSSLRQQLADIERGGNFHSVNQ